MNDIWIYVPGYEGIYEINNNGEIRGFPKTVKKHDGVKRLPSRMIHQEEMPNGYYRVTLSHLGFNKRFLVHRLVAKCFIPNPEKKPYVNHKDGKKWNNNADNLEWVTPSENCRHSIDVLKRKIYHPEKGTNWYVKKGMTNPARKPVLQFDKNGDFIREYQSAFEAENFLKMPHGVMSTYCRGLRNHKQFNFKYKQPL